MGTNIITFIYILATTYLTETTPIATIDVHNFEDDWNFQLQNAQERPLLENPSKIHELPPDTKVEIPEKKYVKMSSLPERAAKKLGDAVRSRVSCPLCRLGVGLLQKEVNKNSSFEDIRSQFISLCTTFKIESEGVCTGIFDVFGPDVLPALKVVKIGPEEICSLILGEVCGNVQNPLHEWKVDFPAKQQEVGESPLPTQGLPTYKVLQISDTHFDPEYAVGSVANCEEPICCRSGSTPPVQGDVTPAGRWGSYEKCDSPKILIDNMLKSIAEQHPDIDYIIWTGDLPPHDIWNQSKTSNLEIIQETVQQMYEHFPKTPIFPALGNHESIPAGSYPPPWVQHPNHTISWLYDSVADHWSKWLPKSTNNSVIHGGFYSVLVRPGFRIISLNTNYCHTLSWWLMVNSTDPAKELKWLINELQEAENRGEKVHLIGHIPPGVSDCMKVWSRNFNAIVERYQHIIKGQFYGHTHNDEFEVLYALNDNDNRKAVGVAYLGPSVTTYQNHNPAYRIYYVDGDHPNSTKEVLDHETWTMDLEDANKGENEPKWYRLYSAKNAYKLESLRPENWSKLIESFINDTDLFELFYKHYYRNSPVRPTCDSQCKLEILCDLRSGRSQDRHQLCHDLEVTFGG